MILTQANTSQLPIDVGDGLTLRRSRREDAERLAEFTARVHSDEGPDKPDEKIWAWTYDLVARPHPTFSPDDFSIVEETSTQKIISAMNLISQTWTYAGIPFKVGRPELVGTLAEYRNRGLIRLQFDLIHQWSAERGEKLQAITGIPYYYCKFGYEMAMNLAGGRSGFPIHIPELKENEAEPYHIRPATEADLTSICKLSSLGDERSLVACVRDENLWRYELLGKTENDVNRVDVRLIENASGERVGFLTHPFFSWRDMMILNRYEIAPEFSWRDVTPSVMRYLRAVYADYVPEHGTKKPFGAFGFWLGEDHPVYHAFPDRLPQIRRPYAWYLRLVDVPDFLRLITPVLEQRLASSVMRGYSGEVKLTFYGQGVNLVFEMGKITKIDWWKPEPVQIAGDAAFPPHTFLQLLFGYRSLDMLKASFADCWTDREEIHVLLSVLFPYQPSNLIPVS